MLAKARALLLEIEPRIRVKATPHRPLTLDRDGEGRLLLHQLGGQYRVVEVLPGRGEHEFFIWDKHDKQRWFHLRPLAGEEVHPKTMSRTFIGTLRRRLGEAWVREVLVSGI